MWPHQGRAEDHLPHPAGHAPSQEASIFYVGAQTEWSLKEATRSLPPKLSHALFFIGESLSEEEIHLTQISTDRINHQLKLDESQRCHCEMPSLKQQAVPAQGDIDWTQPRSKGYLSCINQKSSSLLAPLASSMAQDAADAQQPAQPQANSTWCH